MNNREIARLTHKILYPIANPITINTYAGLKGGLGEKGKPPFFSLDNWEFYLSEQLKRLLSRQSLVARFFLNKYIQEKA